MYLMRNPMRNLSEFPELYARARGTSPGSFLPPYAPVTGVFGVRKGGYLVRSTHPHTKLRLRQDEGMS